MKKNIYTLLLLVFLLINCLSTKKLFAQTKADTDTITARYRTYVLSGTTTPDSTLKVYLDSLQSNGSWNDVNYSDKTAVNWLPLTHLNRVYSICQAYNNKKSTYYHSISVKAKLYLAFTYWNSRNPVSTNWYENDIAWPTVYAKSLLAMKTGDSFGYSQDTLYSLADSGLNYYDVSAKLYTPITVEAIQGSNQTLNLQISMYKACIMDSTDELNRNFDTAFATIKVYPGTSLGMKVDNSFYMHGPQLYNWGYGSAFLSGVSFFAYYSRNTAYATTTENINRLIDFVIDGQQWFQQKNICDFEVTGRGISRSGNLTVSSIRNNCLNYLINLSGGYRTTELNNYNKFANGGNVTFQSPGNKQFYKSDFMVHHGANFYLSVKTPSKRTIASESLNGENLKAKFAPWGVTNIMVNGDEYQNAIPVWDWTRIPGTTAANDPNANFTKMPGNGFITTTSFAGGVTNGVYGLSADAFTWDSVSGKKSYFFTPNGMYCMGAAISSTKKGRYIVTSVNQCMSSGTITMDSAGTQTAFTGQQSKYSNVNWVHHNNVGYLFPRNGNITVANQVQTGSWYSINTTQSATPISNKIFSLWVNHDTLPKTGTYEYIVAPYKSVSQFANWASNCPLKKVANNAGFQAYLDDSAKVFAVAFYSASGLLLDTANNFYVRTNKPALLLIQKQPNGYSISLADPTQLLDSIGITTSVPLSGPNATLKGDSTFINFYLPRGDTAGKTVTNTYLLTNTMPIHFVTIKSFLQNKSNIAINWDVTNEEGIVGFEVEKSVDGNTFSTIQNVPITSISNGNYSVIDNNISTNNYYRIKAIGSNGLVIYSTVTQVAINESSIESYRLFPNPFKGNNLNLSLENISNGKYVITLLNSIGQKLSEQSIVHTCGSATYSLSTNLPHVKGAYKVVVKVEGSNQVVYQTTLINE